MNWQLCEPQLLDFDNCHSVPPDDDVEDCENKAGVPAGLGN